MKRSHVSIQPDLYRHRGWFSWQCCERCKAEFRREAGWRYLTGPWVGGFGRWAYLCFSCGGPTPITATERIAEIESIRRNSRPPAPPPTRYIGEYGA